MSITDTLVSVGPGFFHEAMPLEQLQPSPLNPRKRFTGIEELAQNIREIGVLQPLVARPVGDHYELVAGERRFKAATLAGLVTVPCSVRHLSDAQALEIMVIENNQREDVNALEEADGFSRLLKSGYAIDRLAERIGRSKKYVYDRVKLLELVPDAQTLVFDGRITPSHAILLARLAPEDQARVIDPEARALFEFDNFGIADRTELSAPDPYANAHAISVREFEGWIDENIRLNLAEPVDADLFPEAAVAQEQSEVRRVVFVTEYPVYEDASADVLCRGAWKRADGSAGTDDEGQPVTFERCDHRLLGVVVIGPGRGTTFDVCTDRECDIHWPPERASKSRKTVDARPTEAEAGTAIGSATEEPWAEEHRREEADRARYQQLAPALRMAFLKRIKALKEPALVAFVLDHSDVQNDGLPTATTAIEVLRVLTWTRALEDINATWNAPVSVPKLAKALGVDLKPLLKAGGETAVQTSALKKASDRAPHRSFPKPSAKKKKTRK